MVTNNSALAEVVKSLVNVGRGDSHYDFVYKGFNYRLDAIKAAFLNIAIDYIMAWNMRRRQIFQHYCRLLDGVCKIIMPPENCKSTHHLMVVVLDKYTNRDKLKSYLLDRGIESGIHYPVPIHKTEAYREYNSLSIPNVEFLASRILSLPIFPTMTNEQVRYVCSSFVGGLTNAS